MKSEEITLSFDFYWIELDNKRCYHCASVSLSESDAVANLAQMDRSGYARLGISQLLEK